MKVTINENCIGCEACVGAAPEVFEMNDEGTAQVIAANADNLADFEGDIEDAVAECPVDAIEAE